MSSKPDDVTGLLRAFGTGDRSALDQIVAIVYDELRAIAHSRLGQLRPGQTLNTTGLVHEAYLRLARISGLDWKDRGHFFALSSQLMRQLLLNYARSRRAQKRGGEAQKVPLIEEAFVIPDEHAERLIELQDLLEILEREHPRSATILAHRYFAGLNGNEIAEAMGISTATVERDLRFGRAWLAKEWMDMPSA